MKSIALFVLLLFVSFSSAFSQELKMAESDFDKAKMKTKPSEKIVIEDSSKKSYLTKKTNPAEKSVASSDSINGTVIITERRRDEK
ncbi:MAG: hypothetical protein V4667_04870 [Bacteroidota bacterium]